jgi:hypothetical protein
MSSFTNRDPNVVEAGTSLRQQPQPLLADSVPSALCTHWQLDCSVDTLPLTICAVALLLRLDLPSAKVHKERHVKRQRRLLQYTKLGHLQVAVVAAVVEE